jgi:hypothetical protein
VTGVYTEPTTDDLGELTKIDLLKGIKIRGWIDGYFEGNFNHPKRSAVKANQDLSVVKSRDLTIEGRVFDVHDQSFSFSLGELEIEKVPEMGGVWAKFDLASGDTMDIIVDTKGHQRPKQRQRLRSIRPARLHQLSGPSGEWPPPRFRQIRHPYRWRGHRVDREHQLLPRLIT